MLLLWHNPSVLLTAVEPVMFPLWVSAGTEAAGDESVSNGFTWTVLTFPVCLYRVTSVSGPPAPCCCGLCWWSWALCLYRTSCWAWTEEATG